MSRSIATWVGALRVGGGRVPMAVGFFHHARVTVTVVVMDAAGGGPPRHPSKQLPPKGLIPTTPTSPLPSLTPLLPPTSTPLLPRR